jgi:hypothetical protein
LPRVKSTSVAVALAFLIPQAAQAQLNMTSQNSTNASIAGSSAQSGQSSQASLIGSAIVLGAGLLAGVGGGITTTMYRRDERARRLAQPPPAATPPPPAMEPAPFPDPNAPPPPPPPPPLSKANEAKPTIEAMIEARWWLLANEVQLKQDLALGAGPALDDLAGLARIAPERRAHFGKMMQKNRVLFLLPRDATPEQAARMMSRVGELVLADPILRIDGEAVLAVL